VGPLCAEAFSALLLGVEGCDTAAVPSVATLLPVLDKQDTLAREHSVLHAGTSGLAANARSVAAAVHAGTLSTDSSAGRGQSGRLSQCQQHRRLGGGTPAQLCWQSAGRGGRRAACARRWRGGGTTSPCTAPSTAAAQATCAVQASASKAPACHVSQLAFNFCPVTLSQALTAQLRQLLCYAAGSFQ
jgi:hypothetical protein